MFDKATELKKWKLHTYSCSSFTIFPHACLFTQHIAYFTLQCASCQPGAWCFLLYPSCGSQIGRDLNKTDVYHISTLFPRFNSFSPLFLDIFIAWHCSLQALQLTSRHATLHVDFSTFLDILKSKPS